MTNINPQIILYKNYDNFLISWITLIRQSNKSFYNWSVNLLLTFKANSLTQFRDWRLKKYKITQIIVVKLENNKASVQYFFTIYRIPSYCGGVQEFEKYRQHQTLSSVNILVNCRFMIFIGNPSEFDNYNKYMLKTGPGSIFNLNKSNRLKSINK